jgi:hypothetical protein
MAGNPFSRKKPSSTLVMTKYTPDWQVWRQFKAMETRIVVVPRFTLVTDPINVSTGAERGDPDEKANP